jgi:uncharacterized protein YcnI
MTLHSSRRRSRFPVALIAVALLAAAHATAFGHAVVYPKTSVAGGRERYTVRVPNERTVPTTRIEIQFPPAMRVTSFFETPGWKLEIVRDSTKRITGAVWTGSLPAEHTVEFSFSGVNPADPTEIRWLVLQRYANGEDADWTGPAGSDRPASSTTITAAPDTAGASAPPGTPHTSSPWIAYAALGLSVISLGVALRGSGKA